MKQHEQLRKYNRWRRWSANSKPLKNQQPAPGGSGQQQKTKDK